MGGRMVRDGSSHPIPTGARIVCLVGGVQGVSKMVSAPPVREAAPFETCQQATWSDGEAEGAGGFKGQHIAGTVLVLLDGASGQPADLAVNGALVEIPRGKGALQ